MDKQTAKRRLAEAREAYHQLQMGQAVAVVVDENGERVEYRATRSEKLAAYIAQLERLAGEGTRNRPFGVWL